MLGPFKHPFKTGSWFEQKQKKGSSDQNSHNFSQFLVKIYLIFDLSDIFIFHSNQ